MDIRLDTPIESYAVIARLKANSIAPDPTTFDEVSPRMPFVVGGVWARQQAARLHVLDTIAPDVVSEPLEVAVIMQAETSTQIFFNGELTSSRDPLPAAAQIRIGRGYQNRFWEGRIERFDVYDLNGVENVVGLEQIEALESDSKFLSLVYLPGDAS